MPARGIVAMASRRWRAGGVVRGRGGHPDAIAATHHGPNGLDIDKETKDTAHAPSGFFSISGFTENMMQHASIVSLTPAGGFPMVRTCVDTVATPPRLAHTTRRRSDSLVDGVTVA